MTPSHKIMISDGAPKALFLTPEARKKAWRGVAIRSVPFAQIATTRNESEETKAFRAQVEEARRQKSLAQIGKMKARFATKTIDYSKVRWDPRKSKFVPDTGTKPVAVPVPTPEPYAKDWVRPAAPKFKFPPRATDGHDWSRVTGTNARDLLMLNRVWHEKHDKLKGGLLVMTTRNLLKGLVKKGGEVRWT